ncbi:hypothetical protein [Maribacter sp. 2210JD10-5]|uniref:hypothetical protein n=1 Tax=Maribacter sp. 2210JD10-5 TaxID=3386272 RepID=UPI0039BCAF68
MGQDLREMFKKEREQKFHLKKGHEARFLEKLEEDLPKNTRGNSFAWLKVAASVMVVVGLSIVAYTTLDNSDDIPTTIVDKDHGNEEKDEFSFGDLSPDLKKVENYYVANINMELSRLEVSPENKELVDSFMEQLSELNEEYKNLNAELVALGPNDQTITALIENLQLRLQLLQKLKRKLNELKSSKNEQITENSI